MSGTQAVMRSATAIHCATNQQGQKSTSSSSSSSSSRRIPKSFNKINNEAGKDASSSIDATATTAAVSSIAAVLSSAGAKPALADGLSDFQVPDMPAMPEMPAVPEMPKVDFSGFASKLKDIKVPEIDTSTFDGLKDKATSALDDFDPNALQAPVHSSADTNATSTCRHSVYSRT